MQRALAGHRCRGCCNHHHTEQEPDSVRQQRLLQLGCTQRTLCTMSCSRALGFELHTRRWNTVLEEINICVLACVIYCELQLQVAGELEAGCLSVLYMQPRHLRAEAPVFDVVGEWRSHGKQLVQVQSQSAGGAVPGTYCVCCRRCCRPC